MSQQSIHDLAGGIDPRLLEGVEPAPPSPEGREPDAQAICRLALQKLHAQPPAPQKGRHPAARRIKMEKMQNTAKANIKYLVVVAALLAAAVTAVAAAVSPGFQRLLGFLPAEEARRAQPVPPSQASSAPPKGEGEAPVGQPPAQALTLEPVAVINSGDSANIYLLLAGPGVNGDMDLSDLSVLLDGQRPDTMQPPVLLGCDPEAQQAAAMVQVRAAPGAELEGCAVSLAMTAIPYGRTQQEVELGLDLVPLAVPAGPGAEVLYEEGGPAMGWVLPPDSGKQPLNGPDWLSLCAAGFLPQEEGGGFHLQFKVTASGADKYEVWPELVDAGGQSLGGGGGLSFALDSQGRAIRLSAWEQGADTVYHDWCLDGVASPEDLRGVRLKATLVGAQGVLRGDWRASFTMPAAGGARSAACSLPLGALRLTRITLSPLGVLLEGEAAPGAAPEDAALPGSVTVALQDGTTRQLEAGSGGSGAQGTAYAFYPASPPLEAQLAAAVTAGGNTVELP